VRKCIECTRGVVLAHQDRSDMAEHLRVTP
jgi:ribosomal protein S27AE